jgi:hypothetical protein
MRTSYSFILVFIVLCASAQYSMKSENQFVFLSSGLDDLWTPQTIKIELDANVGSNSFNNGMFNDVLFRSGFISDGKQTFLESQKARTNFYAQIKGEMEYKINSSVGVYAKNRNVVGYSGGTAFMQLILFGNADFQDQKVSSGNLNFLSASAVSGGITLKSVKDKKLNAKLGIGLNAITNYSQIKASIMSLYTANNGGFLEAVFDNFSSSVGGKGMNGIGLDLNYSIDFKKSEKMIFSFKVADLNVNYLFDQNETHIDTTLYFAGYKYQFGSKDASFSKFIDTSFTAIIDMGVVRKKRLSLPSKINISGSYMVGKNSKLILDFAAIDFGNFGMSGSLALERNFSKNLKILSALGYGNFTGLTWREAVEISTTNGFNYYLNFMGLQSAFVPLQTHNYSLGLGVAKHF